MRQFSMISERKKKFKKVLDILAEVVIMQITICAALAVR